MPRSFRQGLDTVNPNRLTTHRHQVLKAWIANGVRVETAAYSEYVVSPYYDSLIAKLVVHANSRPEAIKRMERALETFIIEGIKTSIPLHQKIMRDPDFHAGTFSTTFMQRYLA